MNIFREIIEYYFNCKNILRQISQHGDNLEFETWIHHDTIKINDQFMLRCPNIHFDVVKYETLLVGETRFRFTLHRESKLMRFPKNRKLFDRIFAPTIFNACKKKYKQREKQK